MAWLDWEAAGSTRGCTLGGATGGVSGGVDGGMGELLVHIAEAGLLCPATYLLLRVSTGAMRAAPGAGASAAASARMHRSAALRVCRVSAVPLTESSVQLAVGCSAVGQLDRASQWVQPSLER